MKEKTLLKLEQAKFSDSEILLDELSKEKSQLIRRFVAQNKHTSKSTLDRFLIDQNETVRCSAAENPSVNTESLEAILDNIDEFSEPQLNMLCMIARNSACTNKIIGKLMDLKVGKYIMRDILCCLAQNISCPINILEVLLDDNATAAFVLANPFITKEFVMNNLHKVNLYFLSKNPNKALLDQLDLKLLAAYKELV
jgi:hypothetical protein